MTEASVILRIKVTNIFMRPHLILNPNLKDGECYDHFQDGKSEGWECCDLLRFIELVNGEARIKTQILMDPNSESFLLLTCLSI